MEGEGEFSASATDRPRPAVLELAEEDLVREWITHFGLDHARERPRTHHRIEPLLRQVGPRFRRQRDGAAPLRQLGLELQDELVAARVPPVGCDALCADYRLAAVRVLS